MDPTELVCWIACQLKEDTSIGRDELTAFQYHLDNLPNAYDYYTLITAIIKSDLLVIIKKRLLLTVSALTKYPNKMDSARPSWPIWSAIHILFSLFDIEKQHFQTTRIRPIIIKLGIINILNKLIKISNSKHCDYVAMYVAPMSDIIPCIHTKEWKRFFKYKYGGIRAKHVIQACQSELTRITSNNLDEKWGNNLPFGSRIIEMCTHLLSFKNYRKKLLKKNIHILIMILFCQIVEILGNIFITQNIEVQLNMEHQFLINTGEGPQILQAENINMFTRCLEFIFILKDFLDITLISNDKKFDFASVWNGNTKCIQYLCTPSNPNVKYWQYSIDVIIDKRKKNERHESMIPKTLTYIEDDRYYLSDKCFYSKCSKSSREIKLKRCSVCFCAFYCDKKCQKRDWMNHKQYCHKWSI